MRRHAIASLKRAQRIRLLAGWLLTLTALAGGLLGCATNPATGRPQLMLLNDAQEIRLGSRAAPQVAAKFGGPLSDPAAQRWIQNLGLSIARRSHRPEMPWHFQVLNTELPNAFALPGGYIFITKGLLELLDTQEQVAAALAHEVGHVNAKHVVDNLQRALGTELILRGVSRAAGDRAEVAVPIAKIALKLTSLRFTREQELEADRLGIVYLVRSGRNPWAMVETLEKLGMLEKSKKPGIAELFRTHPHSARRVSQAMRYILEHYPAQLRKELRHTVPPPLRRFHEQARKQAGLLREPLRQKSPA